MVDGGRIDEALANAAGAAGPIVFLTGAGISQESGIPTFRGAEGFWRIGSRHYRPMELATRLAFSAMPDDVWSWYLYRRAICRAATPNAAHRALATLDEELQNRFLLVTQNVDGLHLRAGSARDRVYQIHGNIDTMRCANACSPDVMPLPDALGATWEKSQTLSARDRALLRCATCGGTARPHILWFDECYDEAWFRFDSALAAVERAALFVVVGTSGATNLPQQMCTRVAARGIPWIVVDVEPTPFGAMAERSTGYFVKGSACKIIPAIADALCKR